MEARVTRTGKQVLKFTRGKDKAKHTFVRHPSTGTVVEYIVHKNKK